MTSDYSGQLTSNHVTHENLNPISSKSKIGQWHLVAFFSQKIIFAETRYETHNQELLAIVEVFKTWRLYLEGCKYEVLILTDHNNLRQFMDTKSLSSCQVCWAQEVSRYHFQIDYRQRKANATADALSRFSQGSQAEEKTLRDENTQSFLLFADLTNQGQSSRAQPIGAQNSSLTAPLGPHLRDSRPTVIVSILDPAPRRASLQRALPAGQHWRPEAVATKVAREGSRGLRAQKTRLER